MSWPGPGQRGYEDYLQLPEDGNRYEVIRGHLFMMTPSPPSRHQDVLGGLFQRMRAHAEERRLGKVLCAPLDVIMGKNASPVQPDILFVSLQRFSIIRKDGVFGIPDLVVEILSPSTRRHDRVVKFDLCEPCGVAEYWIVDPEPRRIEIFRLEGGSCTLLEESGPGGVAHSAVLTGFELAVDDLAADTTPT